MTQARLHYAGQPVLRIFLLDEDNLCADDANTMRRAPDFYGLPMPVELITDRAVLLGLMATVALVSGRIGGKRERVQWYVETSKDAPLEWAADLSLISCEEAEQ